WSGLCRSYRRRDTNFVEVRHATTRCNEPEAQASVRAHQAERKGARAIEQDGRADRGRDDEQDASPEGRDLGIPRPRSFTVVRATQGRTEPWPSLPAVSRASRSRSSVACP